METWKIISNTDGLYAVSDLGQIRRTDKGNLLHSFLHNTGYMRVCLSVKGRITTQYVHILVAQAFLGERPKGHDVNHKNGDKTLNVLSNLEYLDRKAHEHHTRNVLKRQRSPIGSQHGNAILTEDAVRAIHTRYSTGNVNQAQLAEEYGVSVAAVSGVLNGYNWKHLGLPRPSKRKYHLKGMDNPMGKVSPELAEQIQQLYASGHSANNLAKQFRLGRTTIYRVINSSHRA